MTNEKAIQILAAAWDADAQRLKALEAAIKDRLLASHNGISATIADEELFAAFIGCEVPEGTLSAWIHNANK
jgi:hypothetical protein